jgi:ABC-type Mn2+/Zn2+ transport system ATPase subunit
MIDNYKKGYSGFIQNLLVMGVAGSGKTTLQECIGLYALEQGLSVIAVSLTAERANQIGGVHAHKLFCFGVRKYIGAGKMAETAWVKLLTRPENLEVICRVDVHLWDEVLNCSDYFLHAVDSFSVW